MHLSLKMFSGMANSEDLIRLFLQEQSGLGLHCLHMAFCQKLWCSILGHLPYIEMDLIKIVKGQISICICAVWSGSSLFGVYFLISTGSVSRKQRPWLDSEHTTGAFVPCILHKNLFHVTHFYSGLFCLHMAYNYFPLNFIHMWDLRWIIDKPEKSLTHFAKGDNHWRCGYLPGVLNLQKKKKKKNGASLKGKNLLPE